VNSNPPHMRGVCTRVATPPLERATPESASPPHHIGQRAQCLIVWERPHAARRLYTRAPHTKGRRHSRARGLLSEGADSVPLEVVVDAAVASAISRAAAASSAAAARGYQSSGRRRVVEAAAKTSEMSAEHGCPGA